MPGGVIPGTHLDKFATAYWNKAKIKFEGQGLIFHKNSYTKRSESIKVTCTKHGLIERQAGNMMNSAYACPKCSNENRRKLPTYLEAFIDAAEEVHGDRYEYPVQEYAGPKAKVTIVCHIHGEFQQTAVAHLTGSGCKRCNLSAGTLRYTTDTFIEKAKIVHEGRNYDYSKTVFVSGHDNVIVICPVHGEYTAEASTHIKGAQCRQCTNIQSRCTTDEFINKAVAVHDDRYDYTKTMYFKADEKVIITCRKHGDFEQTPNCHLGGCGCKKCATRNSKKATLWLEYMSIATGLRIQHADNDGEFYVPHLYPGKKRLDIRVDGYCEATNTVYEFAGDSFHGNPRKYPDPDKMHWCINKTYGELYQNTLDREAWLKSLGYDVVTIWEMDWDRAVKMVVKIQRAFRKARKIRS